ncbi:MAG: hypothetical protein FWC99_07255 [Coriobacteriia bacterium]|nr:hypothetical protein [Coriobacteriia bacterium]
MALYDEIYEIAADNYGLITSREAKMVGASDKEMSRLTGDGRLTRLGYGVYRIKHYTPTPHDPYAEAVALVGPKAYLFGESVIAMHGLAPTNPARITVATPVRTRKTLPSSIKVIHRKDKDVHAQYEGIPSQSIADAIRTARNTMMVDRLKDATENARREGLITGLEETALLKELS